MENSMERVKLRTVDHCEPAEKSDSLIKTKNLNRADSEGEGAARTYRMRRK